MMDKPYWIQVNTPEDWKSVSWASTYDAAMDFARAEYESYSGNVEIRIIEVRAFMPRRANENDRTASS